MKIIVLDDVLIGLDMSNRMPVLNILRQYFADWQLIILTHDRVWYDMVRHQTKEVDWCYYELHCGRDVEAGFDRPYSRAIKEGWNHLLQRARHILNNMTNELLLFILELLLSIKSRNIVMIKGCIFSTP